MEQTRTTTSMACPMCAEPATKLCSRCRNIRYCSRTCQETDHRFHKKLCNKFKDFATPPEATQRRVIYFPADGPGPQFIWLPLSHDSKSVVTDSLRSSNPLHNKYLVRQNFWTAEPLGKSFQVYFNRALVDKDSAANRAVVGTVGTKKKIAWGGPLLVVCGEPDDRTGSENNGLTKVLNADLETFTACVAVVVRYHASSKQDVVPMKKISIVRVARDGETAKYNTPQLQAIELSPISPLFDEACYVCQLPKYILMPLAVVPIAPSPNALTDLTNTVHQQLLMCCDANAFFSLDRDEPAFGGYPDPRLGACMVYRMDGQDLSADMLSAFLSYSDLFGRLFRGGIDVSPNITGPNALLVANPEHWESYLADALGGGGGVPRERRNADGCFVVPFRHRQVAVR